MSNERTRRFYLLAEKSTLQAAAPDNAVVAWQTTYASDGITRIGNSFTLPAGRRYVCRCGLALGNNAQLHWQVWNVTSEAFIGMRGQDISPLGAQNVGSMPALAYIETNGGQSIVEVLVHPDSTLPDIVRGWIEIQEVG